MPTASIVGFDPDPVLGSSVIGTVGEGESEGEREGVGDGIVPWPPVDVLVGEDVAVDSGGVVDVAEGVVVAVDPGVVVAVGSIVAVAVGSCVGVGVGGSGVAVGAIQVTTRQFEKKPSIWSWKLRVFGESRPTVPKSASPLASERTEALPVEL
ncbi:MAG: hypothetical protein R2845_08055 [Thermomicrobiales bacterium]